MSSIVQSDSNAANIKSNSNSTSTSSTDLAGDDKNKKILALPESSPHNNSSDTTQLDMSNGGTSIKLDRLGPMVVNADGTLSRISNWDKMADIERENTLRIIGKRNQARLEELRRAKEEEGK